MIVLPYGKIGELTLDHSAATTPAASTSPTKHLLSARNIPETNIYALEWFKRYVLALPDGVMA